MIDKAIWVKFEANLQNRGLTRKRIKKLITMYNIVTRNIKPSILKATREDIENFVTDLHNNNILKLNGKRFSGSTKADIKKFLKQFFKAMKGDNEFYPREVAWIRTRIAKDEKPKQKPVATIAEVMGLSKHFRNPEFAILVLLFFDSGFRIEEMLSVKKKDLSWSKYSDNEKCFWIACNESKTEPRKVPVPLFTDDIRMFVNTSYFLSLDSDDKLFKSCYGNVAKNIKEMGLRHLGKNLTPHCLRHSSASFWASQLDYWQLCERFGWSYSSDQAKTYVRRSGKNQVAAAKKVFTNELILMQERMDKLEKAHKVLLDKVK